LVHADDENFLGENLNSIKKNTEALLQVCKEAGLKVNIKMLICHHQNAEQNPNIKKGNGSSENVTSSNIWEWH
jgi:hypothetical protein